MALKSVDSPSRSALESFDGIAGPARELAGGLAGTSDYAPSRAATRYLVKGTSTSLPKPTSALESLLTDTDRRKEILETEKTPWRMICALEITGQDGSSYIGTGWLVAPKTVITAGHCVFDPIELGGWAKSIVVIPGRDDAEEPFERTTSQSFSTTDTWLAAQEADFDYAAIHLDKDFGSQTGAFVVGVLPDADLAGRLVNISGYPVSPGNGQNQFFHANRVKAVTPRRVFYDVDTMGGQSGSPVWVYLDGSDAPVVVAIHAYGLGGVPAALAGLTANSGPRIVPEVLEVIKGWMARGTA